MASRQRTLSLWLFAAALTLNLLSVRSAPEIKVKVTSEDRDDTAALANSAVDNAAEPNTKFVVITEDVIPDIENTTQKVIRVNPLDLPPIVDDPSGTMDSSLYKIQTIMPLPLSPSQRHYVSSNRMRRPPPTDSPIVRHLPDAKLHKPKSRPKQKPKKKHLHFLYNQEGLDGRVVGQTMQVRVAPGAYPVYYAVAKTNGRFGKFPIKGFRSEDEFVKHLVRNKAEPIEMSQRYES